MEIIVDKARKTTQEPKVKVPKQKTLSAGIRKSFPSCTLKEIFIPQKYEALTLLFYLLFVPFIIGHLFLFTYVSGFNFSVYSAVNAKNNMFLTWCIGYELFTILFFILLTLFSVRKSLS